MADLPASVPRTTGNISSKDPRGYGHIRTQDGAHVFFHAKALPKTKPFDELAIGQRVEFAVKDESALRASKNPRAKDSAVTITLL